MKNHCVVRVVTFVTVFCFCAGQLECDVILPPSTGSFASGEQLSVLLEQPRGHDLTVYERSVDNVVINIGTASLV